MPTPAPGPPARTAADPVAGSAPAGPFPSVSSGDRNLVCCLSLSVLKPTSDKRCKDPRTSGTPGRHFNELFRASAAKFP